MPVRMSLADNPFSTRRVRPGAIPFLFPPGESADLVVRTLERHGWRGEIIGPHGSGKSTLVATLVPKLIEAGRAPLVITLHEGQRQLPSESAAAIRNATPTTVVVIDGYEQLGRLSRWRLGRACHRQGCGLLVTAHHSVGLPSLYQTRPDVETAVKIVQHLTRSGTPSDLEVARQFADSSENMRETLFRLYDLVEQRNS